MVARIYFLVVMPDSRPRLGFLLASTHISASVFFFSALVLSKHRTLGRPYLPRDNRVRHSLICWGACVIALETTDASKNILNAQRQLALEKQTLNQTLHHLLIIMIFLSVLYMRLPLYMALVSHEVVITNKTTLHFSELFVPYVIT